MEETLRNFKLFLSVLAAAFVLLLSTATPSQAIATDLLLTGVVDGPLTGGLPKAVELYVVNDIPDLSLYGLGSANNGGGTDGQEFYLSRRFGQCRAVPICGFGVG
jgi:hypothetical protein